MTAIEIIRANPGLTAPELVRRFGLRDSTYRTAARYHGIQLPHVAKSDHVEHARQGRRRKYNCDRNEAYVRAHYGHEPTGDIALELGTSANAVRQMAARLGLRFTKEQRAALRADADRKRIETMRRRKPYMIALQLSGKAKPTHNYNAFNPKPRALARNRLVTNYGYIYLEGDSTNLGYDSTTDRCTQWSRARGARKPEEYYAQRYGIHFYDLEDE